ncbi:hypothetical protein C7377_0833 [Balneicella halophila]|uniref:Uncharacterized protein n=1 Tax=Balneicella halophila TaxID=1537566 RepID=A0A7L4US71_BALHA|nr:hypothetical protein C7377_0833 [Balneicella halophila]
MINDMPGIYAKIIEQEPNRFTSEIDYKLYQLKKIVLK